MFNLTAKTTLEDGSIVEWGDRQITNMQTTSQSNTNASSIYYGMVSNSGTMSILDIGKEIQSMLEGGELSPSNFNIGINLNDRQIRSHIASSVRYSIFENKLDVTLTDVMEKWNHINIPKRLLTDPKSAFQLLSELMAYTGYTNIDLMCSNNIEVEGNIITIKEYLENIVIEYPYLEAGMLSEQINKICQLAQLQLIIDETGYPKFISPRPRLLNAITTPFFVKDSDIYGEWLCTSEAVNYYIFQNDRYTENLYFKFEFVNNSTVSVKHWTFGETSCSISVLEIAQDSIHARFDFLGTIPRFIEMDMKISGLGDLQGTLNIQGKSFETSLQHGQPTPPEEYHYKTTTVKATPKFSKFDKIIKVPQNNQYSHLEKDIIKQNRYNSTNMRVNNIATKINDSIFASENIKIYDETNYVGNQDENAPKYNMKYLDHGEDEDYAVYVEFSYPLSDINVLYNSDKLDQLLKFKVNENRNNYLYLNQSINVDENPNAEYEEYIPRDTFYNYDNFNTEIVINGYVYKIEDGLIKIKASIPIRKHVSSAPIKDKQYRIFFVQSLSFSIVLGETHSSQFSNQEISAIDGDIKTQYDFSGNELLQTETKYMNSTKMVDLIADNIIADYKKGVSTANIRVSIADYYDTDGNLVKSQNAGEIISVGDVVQIEGDEDLWRVTGNPISFAGSTFMDLELMQVFDTIQTEKTVVAIDMSKIEGSNVSLSLPFSSLPINIDWGDGSSETCGTPTISHTYANSNFVGYIMFDEKFAGFDAGSASLSLAQVVTGIILGNKCTNIPNSSFAGFINMIHFDFADTGTITQITVGDSAFAGSGIESIEFPDNATLVYSTFTDCSKLKTVKLPKSLTKIPDNTFLNCSQLKTISIPLACEEIGQFVFSGTAITNIRFSNNIKRILFGAFDEDSPLKTITIRATTPPELEGMVFPESISEIYIPRGTLSAYSSAQYWSNYKDKFIEQ